MSQAIEPSPNQINRFHLPPRKNELILAVNTGEVENLSHCEIILLGVKLGFSPKFEYRQHPITGADEIWVVFKREYWDSPLTPDHLVNEFEEISNMIEPSSALVFASRIPNGMRQKEVIAA